MKIAKSQEFSVGFVTAGALNLCNERVYFVQTPFIIKVLIPRSLCLLKLGKGKAALDDVLEALKAGYPEENR